MRKSTFYGFAAICGVGSLLAGLVLWDDFFGGVTCGGPPSMRTEQDFVSIYHALKIYYINAGRPPTTSQGLDALVNEPMTGPKPKRWTQVMRKVPADPWGVPYRYALLEPKDREWRWELRSAGQDGLFGNGDDLAEEAEAGGTPAPSAIQVEATLKSNPSY